MSRSLEYRPLPTALFEGHPAAVGGSRIDRALARLARQNLFSGALLLARGNDILFQGAYGAASREYGVANTLNTKFNLASAGKMFTAVAIGKLVDEGRIKFNDPASDHLDSTWLAPVVAREVRVGDLLAHTSGLPEYFGPAFFDRSRTLFTRMSSYKPLIAGSRPTFPPGSRFSYSNTNFILLGAIVQRITGRNYWTFVNQVVFRPAGMADSGPLDLEHVNHDYAQGYAKAPSAPPSAPPRGRAQRQGFRERAMRVAAAEAKFAKRGFQWRNNILTNIVKGMPSGGSYSTAHDLLRFTNALTSGRLVSLRTLRVMTAPKPHAPDFAYGFQLLDGGFGHTGGFPGISTAIIIYPDGSRLVVLSNVDAGSVIAYAELVKLAGAAGRPGLRRRRPHR